MTILIHIETGQTYNGQIGMAKVSLRSINQAYVCAQASSQHRQRYNTQSNVCKKKKVQAGSVNSGSKVKQKGNPKDTGRGTRNGAKHR